MSASVTPYSRVKVVVNAEGIASGFIGASIAEWYLGRHDAAWRRDRRPHVHRGRSPPRPRAGPRGRLRRRPDLPEEPAPVGDKAPRGSGDPDVSRGPAANRHPARLCPLELPHQPREPGPVRVGAGGEPPPPP